MFVKGMTRGDYERMLGESTEDMDDVLDGLDEAPVSAFGNFEDEED